MFCRCTQTVKTTCFSVRAMRVVSFEMGCWMCSHPDPDQSSLTPFGACFLLRSFPSIDWQQNFHITVNVNDQKSKNLLRNWRVRICALFYVDFCLPLLSFKGIQSDWSKNFQKKAKNTKPIDVKFARNREWFRLCSFLLRNVRNNRYLLYVLQQTDYFCVEAWAAWWI